MLEYGQKRQNAPKTLKWSIALKLRFYANLSRNRSKLNLTPTGIRCEDPHTLFFNGTF